MNLYQFMSDSPYLSFFIAYLLSEGAVRVGARMMRSINIAIRGWPPAHLDADGDFRKEGEG